MNNDIKNQAYWHNRHNKITTNIGKWVGGDDVNIRQYSLFNDLFGKVTYMQVIVLNITGRLISKELSTWLENNFLCMSYPDARIWCNQIGALAGSKKSSPTAASVAGALAADSRAYGGSQTTKIAMQYIKRTLKHYKALQLTIKDDNKIIESIINDAPFKQQKPAIVGFVRPVNKKDERIQPHKDITSSLGFGIGEHMTLANKISDYLFENYNSGINIGGYTAAFLADQGFSPHEGYQIKNSCVVSGVTACYTDNLKHDNNEFLPLKCSDVEYSGKKIRTI